MWMRSVGLGATAAGLLALASGCGQSSSNNSTQPAPKPQAAEAPGFETVARFHWLGKAQLAFDTNATHFLSIWNLPEAVRLENQTLDKLATALASSLSPSNTAPSFVAQPSTLAPRPLPTPPPTVAPLSAAAAMLRPFLVDLVQEESYFEIGAATNQPGELVLAVRLSPERAHFWETNLSSALDRLTGRAPGTNSARVWTLATPNPHALAGSATNAGILAPKSIRLDRAGDWTVLDLTRGTNTIMSQVLARIQRDGAPFAKASTNYWMDTTFDLAGISRLLSLSLPLPANWPLVKMTVNGEGENVRTRGELDFPQSLSVELTPWNIPTNLIHDPLIGFSAIRGIGPLLQSLPVWKDLRLSSAPDQVYAWSQAGMPILEYLAARWRGSEKIVTHLSKTLPELVNPWLKTKAMGYLTNSTAYDGLTWEGAPFITPRLRSVADETGEYVFTGLVPLVRTNQSVPEDLLRELASDPARIAYSWEMTGPRITQVLYVTQLARMITKAPQLPAESASVDFLKAGVTNLANCITVATAHGGEIIFTRKSSCGFNALELQLLADWLESPTFPFGLHSSAIPSSSTPINRVGASH